MSRWLTLLLGLGFLLITSVVLGVRFFGVAAIYHQPASAAKAAEAFAERAFVRSDAAGAYAEIAPELKASLPEAKLAEVIGPMHPAGRPTSVTAVEYEPVPGQRAMLIFLKGAREGEDFFYRFLMLGDATWGYRVAGLYRGNGPYPPSGRRPL